jgi:hypothetical protein
MPATTTGAPFSLNIPSASTDAADLFGLYLKPNMTALNTNAAHKGTAQTFSALQTFSAGLTVSAGTLTAAAGLTVSASGVSITGNSTITGTLGGLTGLTVASGGASITGNSTITGTLGGLTGLTVASGGASITGNSTITGTLGSLTGLTLASGIATVPLGTVSAPTVVPSGSTTTGMWFPATTSVAWSSGGSEKMRVDGTGVGIGQTSPGSALDVKGVVRLSGSSSGYVGLQGAAAAGSTTYTFPSADGAAGTVLSTNGAGTLSWATASGGGGGARAILLMGA